MTAACFTAGGRAAAATAAEPLLEKVDLFEAGNGGYAQYRIPGVVVTARGTVLAYCEARRAGGDWAPIDVFLRRSVDGGRTWGAPRQVAHLGDKVPRNPVALAKKPKLADGQTVNNPVAVVDRASGAVHFLYCVEYARCFYQRSDDDGQTFTRPADVTPAFDDLKKAYDFKVIATGPGHGVQLRTGRLLVPVWLSLGTGGNGHRPSVVATIYSDDAGKTWRAGQVAIPDSPETANPSETAVVELADGRVMLNARSESKSSRRLVVTSADGATGWSAPRFDPALPEPVCMASLARLPGGPAGGGRDRLLFANPDGVKRDAAGREMLGKPGDRKDLTVRLSDDGGTTWPVAKRLEDGPSAYSDVAVLPDGTILCFYERAAATAAAGDVKPSEGTKSGGATTRPAKPNPYGRLTVARFNLEWLTDGNGATR